MLVILCDAMFILFVAFHCTRVVSHIVELFLVTTVSFSHLIVVNLDIFSRLCHVCRHLVSMVLLNASRLVTLGRCDIQCYSQTFCLFDQKCVKTAEAINKELLQPGGVH